MKTWLLHLWDRLSSSYWFVPALMVTLAGMLAFGMLAIDRDWPGTVKSGWFYTGGSAGARALLSTVAGSVITVAGVVFSITIATLTQASSQFGPRLLRNFMRDKGNQIVLGTFTATFFYCLLVLRAVRGLEDEEFVPNVSVTVAVLLAVGSLAVLIYFIDHICRSLQGPQVVAAVGIELERAVRRPYPTDIGQGPQQALGRPDQKFSPDSINHVPVLATENGYLQAIDEAGVIHLATEHDALLHLAVRPGDFVNKGNPLLFVEGATLDQPAKDSLIDMFFLGRQRTAEQDVEYSVRQLVEIAVRALSPGINDPFTAINCVDWLGAAISAVAEHGLPSPNRYDDEKHCRVIAKVSTFNGLTDAAFNQIRQYSGGSVAVTLRLLEVMLTIGKHLRTPAQCDTVKRHTEMIYQHGRACINEPADLAELDNRYHAAVEAIIPHNDPPAT